MAAVVLASLAICNGGVSEEPGWRGWLQPTLQTRRSALRAALYTGLFWSAWHFGPEHWRLVFTGEAHIALLFTALGALDMIPLSVILAYIYNHTGSLLLPILFHAMANTASSLVHIAWPGTELYPEFVLGYFVLAIVLIRRVGGARKADTGIGGQSDRWRVRVEDGDSG